MNKEIWLQQVGTYILPENDKCWIVRHMLPVSHRHHTFSNFCSVGWSGSASKSGATTIVSGTKGRSPSAPPNSLIQTEVYGSGILPSGKVSCARVGRRRRLSFDFGSDDTGLLLMLQENGLVRRDRANSGVVRSRPHLNKGKHIMNSQDYTNDLGARAFGAFRGLRGFYPLIRTIFLYGSGKERGCRHVSDAELEKCSGKCVDVYAQSTPDHSPNPGGVSWGLFRDSALPLCNTEFLAIWRGVSRSFCNRSYPNSTWHTVSNERLFRRPAVAVAMVGITRLPSKSLFKFLLTYSSVPDFVGIEIFECCCLFFTPWRLFDLPIISLACYKT